MTWLRSLLFNVVFFCLGLVFSLWGIVFCHRPDSALAVGRAWARLCLGAARVLCGIRFEVSGAEHLPTGAALIASAHQSAFDTLIWFGLVKLPSYVLKRELARLPLFGPLAMRSGMIAVDRAGGGAALRALVRDCAAAAAKGRQIVIFPQGTRAAIDAAVQLQPGVAAIAAHTGLPVVPVWTDSGRLWGRRSFAKRAGVVQVRVLPPLPPGLGRKALMAALAEAYAPVDKHVHSNTEELSDHGNVFS